MICHIFLYILQSIIMKALWTNNLLFNDIYESKGIFFKDNCPLPSFQPFPHFCMGRVSFLVTKLFQTMKTKVIPKGVIGKWTEKNRSQRTAWSKGTSPAFNCLGMAFIWENKTLLFPSVPYGLNSNPHRYRWLMRADLGYKLSVRKALIHYK